MRLPTCSQHSRLAFSRIFNATATTVIYTLSLHDALPISALQLGGGVVKVHDDILCTFTSLEGAANQVLTRLNQNLDGDIFWNQVLLNDFTHEVEVGLRCRRETHLNFLVAHLHQQLEHAVLTCRRHRVDQSLIAIAQVNSTPLGCNFNLLIWPSAVRQRDLFDFLGESQIAVYWHGRCALLIPCRLAFAARPRWSSDFARSRDERVFRRHGD